MDKMKQQILRQLIGNVIADKCAVREHLIFKPELCSQERIIRFTSHFMKELFPNDGEFAMYEAVNNPDSFIVNCVREDGRILGSWDITESDPNNLFEVFDVLLDETIPHFEKELEADLSQEEYTEGEKRVSISSRYERNHKARAACLAHHGYTCKYCGMNFETVYGPEFRDIIEVHHIVPLNQIGENYVVDPIKDLVPLCPNCHAAIHSKYGAKILINR